MQSIIVSLNGNVEIGMNESRRISQILRVVKKYELVVVIEVRLTADQDVLTSAPEDPIATTAANDDVITAQNKPRHRLATAAVSWRRSSRLEAW